VFVRVHVIVVHGIVVWVVPPHWLP
jgi:hypothetical protein